MNANDVVTRLRAHEQELRDKGVLSLTLFGSVARGETSPDDVDLAAEFDRSKHLTLLNLSDIQYTLSGILDAPVNLSDRSMLKEFVRQNAERDFIHVF